MSGVLLLFILGITGEVAAAQHLSFWIISEELISGLGEAFLVSGILAVLVDPAMKRRMQDESAWGAIFGYLNPAAPEGLREAVREIVKPRSYVKRCHWDAKFKWHDEPAGEPAPVPRVLVIELGIYAESVNLDPKRKYEITGTRWVLGSIPGKKTEYLECAMTCSEGDFPPLVESGEKLQAYVEPRDDGTLVLDAGKLAKGWIIPPAASWSDARKAKMFRNSSGYIPLHNRSYAEEITVTVSGAALCDLQISVTVPSRDFYEPLELSENKVHFRGNAPGQLILLSWRLRGGEPQEEGNDETKGCPVIPDG
ncbi:hypothetical protein ACIO93_42415 [Streptomyces sp. NPDC087903]|uniref:hypothetical protein n=1 Tax=Streptomyces sp. NPDC087903 TaxID=3365819 RepID=UPI00380B5985